MAEGLYFRREDYAGFWLRLWIDLIDVSIVAGICIALTIALLVILPATKALGYAILSGCAIIVFSYFVVLKRTRIGTPGYIVGGVRIIGLNGELPGWYPLILRLLFALMGPLNPVVDLVWISNDKHRQALRDKFARTYVIKKNAQPIGTGKIVYRHYDVFAWNFIFREVEPGSDTRFT